MNRGLSSPYNPNQNTNKKWRVAIFSHPPEKGLHFPLCLIVPPITITRLTLITTWPRVDSYVMVVVAAYILGSLMLPWPAPDLCQRREANKPFHYNHHHTARHGTERQRVWPWVWFRFVVVWFVVHSNASFQFSPLTMVLFLAQKSNKHTYFQGNLMLRPRDY